MKMHFFGYQSKFFYLLSSLILYFVSTSFLSGVNYTDPILNTLFSLIILFCLYAISRNKVLVYTTLLLGIFAAVNHWFIVYFHDNHTYFAFSCLAVITFLSLITYSVLQLIIQHKEISPDTLLGAICGYLLLGLTWTFIYILIEIMNPGAFSNHIISPSIHERTQYYLYFSFTTLTTLGYGDILPLSDIARTFSWLEAVVGQIYLAVWISQLVGLRIAQRFE